MHMNKILHTLSIVALTIVPTTTLTKKIDISLNKAFLKAIESNDVPAVETLFCGELTPDINAQDKHGNSMLRIAIFHFQENLALVKLLIALGIDVNSKKNFSPLGEAIDRGHRNIALELIRAHADVDPLDYGKTPLMRAVLADAVDVVQALVAAGCNVNAQGDEGTALHLASYLGHVSIAQELIAAGADVNVQNSYGRTALMHALWCNNEDHARALVHQLIAAHADVHIQDDTGKTALDHALQSSRWQDNSIVDLLQATAARTAPTSRPYWRFTHEGHSQLITTIERLADKLYCDSEVTGGENYATIIQEYVEKFKLLLLIPDAPINQGCKAGITPLMYAACHNQWEIVELLLAAGADSLLTDNEGRTALSWIAQRLHAARWAPMGRLIDMVMSGYYTKERHNKCVDLLAKNMLQRLWYKRLF